MRRHITIPRAIIALALLTAVSRQDYAPLVDLIAFPIALSLFVISAEHSRGAALTLCRGVWSLALLASSPGSPDAVLASALHGPWQTSRG